ncbi:cytochrome c-type biogenesis protein [Thermomonas flagellata]|uniref:cytochrome c-type biogenesis protein n=1 Tax=Thermomonas flagellata TaxID=2888524 RepID=UPI001F040AD0|nr:cytochrome c-type biogenesis protein [Thermomonas flagellata]
MNRIATAALALLLGLVPPLARAQANQQADAAPLRFHDPAEEARFHALTAELRCVMCQNQSLADSNALIALNLRREVLALMRQGKSDDEIKNFLVQRYGEFVLYRPRLEARTWLLWLGPGLLLAGGAVALALAVRRRRPSTPPQDDEEQEW